MTAHAHTEHIPACPRCDLSRDEVKAIREADFVRAEETTTCPRCDAQPGDQCRTASGRWRRNPHKVRIEAMESNHD